MASLKEVRSKYPQYDDMSDEQFATSFHKKFYADMPFDDFSAKVGYAPQDSFDPSRVALPDVNIRDARREGNQREFDNLATWKKPFVALDDMATIAANGITFGAAPWAAAHAKSYMNGTPYEQERSKINRGIDDSRDRAGLAGFAAEMGGGVGAGLKIASKGLTATRPLGNLLGLTADGAALGAADAFFNDQDVASGALGGAAFGAGGQVVAKGVGKAISPFVADPERLKQAGILAKEGIPLTAGQKTGSKALGYLESEVGGGKLQDFAQEQGEAFTGAALSRIGAVSNRATPDVIDGAYRKIGGEFDALASRNAMIPDPQVAGDITQVVVDYSSLVAPSMRSPLIEKTATDVIGLLQTQGRIDGKVYKTLRSRLTTVARQSADPELKQAASGLVDALDGGMERSIAQYNPADAGAWKDVRNKYRNLLVVEDAATRAGGDAAMGILSPAALRNATVNKHGRRNYAKGSGDFAELARAGEAVMKPLPNSGTAARLAARGLMGGVGATIGTQEGGIQGGLIGMGTGILAPQAIGRAMLSKTGRKYLGNQAVTKVSKAKKDAILRALTIGGASSGLMQPQN